MDKKVIIIAGPTASGKSAYALSKALQYGGGIINTKAIREKEKNCMKEIFRFLSFSGLYKVSKLLCQQSHKLFPYVVYVNFWIKI